MARPNVVVFFTDQQRWDSSGLHGNPLNLMPNFDRMAMQGTFVRHSISCQPVCGPARACLQTGKYASAVGVPTNGVRLPESEKTLAHYFSDAGYQTGYIGKWHLAGKEFRSAVPAERCGATNIGLPPTRWSSLRMRMTPCCTTTRTSPSASPANGLTR